MAETRSEVMRTVCRKTATNTATKPLPSSDSCQRLDIAERFTVYFGLELQLTQAKAK
jgi:hypothetical protein